MSDPRDILTRIEQRQKALGLSDNAVGANAGLSRDWLRSLRRGVTSGTRRSIETETIAKLAAALETTPEWLLTGATNTVPAEDQAAPAPPGTPSDVELVEGLRPPSPGHMKADVPVLGTAMGSVFDNQEGFTFEGGAIDYLRRPPALANIRDLYAIYVVNDSMWPMHPAGEVRFVNPRRPPQIGGTVIVQTRAHDGDPGQAYIKLLRRRTPSKIVLEQFNPPLTIEIPNQFVRSIHHVYTMNELFGI